jgi:hypothetical protein
MIISVGVKHGTNGQLAEPWAALALRWPVHWPTPEMRCFLPRWGGRRTERSPDAPVLSSHSAGLLLLLLLLLVNPHSTRGKVVPTWAK